MVRKPKPELERQDKQKNSLASPMDVSAEDTSSPMKRASIKKKAVLSIDPPFPTIQEEIDGTSPSKKPSKYLMSHLFVSGFRAGEYQLLVLLSKAVNLLIDKNVSFAALVEGANFGNLDDVAFVIRKRKKGAKKIDSQKSIEAYQVKYYDHPITIYEFFNEKETVAKKEGAPNGTNKNEKMHIGKFFDGWLNWKKKYSKIPEENISSIVYTNTSLDAILDSCIQDGKFSKDFINRQGTKIIVSRKEGVTKKINKNFLTKLKRGVTNAASTKVWEALVAEDYLTAEGNLTEKFVEDDISSKLNLKRKSVLPEGVTSKQVFGLLKEKYDNYKKNRVDLFKLLFDEAWNYISIKAKEDHAADLAKKLEEKQEIFKAFLKSMHFQSNQPNLQNLTEDVQGKLYRLPEKYSSQVYLCLYNAIHDWFCKEYPKRQVPILTKSILKNLLKTSKSRSSELNNLQGRTEAKLSYVRCDSGGRTVSRPEFDILSTELNLEELIENDEFNKSKFVMIEGEKGMGKSGLLKQYIIENKLDKNEYLFLPAQDLVQDESLRLSATNVLQCVASIRIVVIDGAEVLSLLDKNEVKNLFGSWSKKNRIIVLTLTSDAMSDPIIKDVREKFTHTVIKVEGLPLDQLKKLFPVLTPYHSLKHVMDLVQKPIELDKVMKIISQMDESNYDYVLKNKSINDLELTKLVVVGHDPKMAQFRQIDWQRLASLIFKFHGVLNEGIESPKKGAGLDLLIKECIVVEKDGYLSFFHDQYYEHGLMASWLQMWETAYIQNETVSFWKNFSLQFNYSQAKIILRKWLSFNHKQLFINLNECISTIVKLPILEDILYVTIVSGDNVSLEIICKNGGKNFKNILNGPCHYKNNTFVSVAILHNNVIGLKILLSHGANFLHPNANHIKLAKKETDAICRKSLKKYSKYSGYPYELSHNGEETFLWQIIKEFVGSPEKYWLIEDVSYSSSFYQDDEYSENYHSPRNQYLYLHQFVCDKRTDLLEILLQHLNDLDKKKDLMLYNDFHESPLHTAVLEKAEQCVDVILKSGRIDIDDRDCFGETALHNAVYEEDTLMVNKLLENDADPNFVNAFGITPCHIALVKMNIKLLSVLFKHGGGLGSISDEEDPDQIQYPIVEILKLLEEDKDEDEFEEFVIELIKLLNYGWEEDASLNIESEDYILVQSLMPFINHRAQLSKIEPKFDYWDDESRHKYNGTDVDSEDMSEKSGEDTETEAAIDSINVLPNDPHPFLLTFQYSREQSKKRHLQENIIEASSQKGAEPPQKQARLR